MSSPATIGGPVSAALEADVRSWVRRHGIVVWLDVDGHYTAFVDRLRSERSAGRLAYEVRALRGSYLELMLALETLGGGTDKVPLLIHLPGCNEDTVRTTPLLELYAAGVRYRKALDTLVTEAAAGRVRPEQITAIQGQPELTLDGADAWLAALLGDREGGLAAQLLAMKPTALLDDLLSGGLVASRIGLPQGGDEDVVWDRLAAWTGAPADWQKDVLRDARPRARDLAYAAASWALCVEYVDDLRRPPVSARLVGSRDLPASVIATCRAIATHLRESHPSFYRQTAEEIELHLADEVSIARAEDLGQIDTFRFEEDKVLKAALAALGEGQWQSAAEWANPRAGGGSFWVTCEPLRQSAWQLVQGAAELGLALARAGQTIAARGGLVGALERYVEVGAAVDQAHRHLEQRRVQLLYPQMPEFETLRARLDGMRTAWRDWADAWAREWNALCRTHGFVPEAAYQQRTLFEDVVRPLSQEGGPMAYFVVDAFRFEMGQEFYQALKDAPATTVHLKARLAELPTVTEVGMNVLAPVAQNGRLRPALAEGAVQGFSTGEFRVNSPDSRKRAMHDRVGGATCPWLPLSEIVTLDSAKLKQKIAQARLIVIHSQEIDSAGETGVGPAVFDGIMQQLRAAWQLLREAGVRRFVFTADHGFLLLDDGTATAQAHGRRIDPKRRHVFSSVAADHRGEVRVALSDLGYDGVSDHLMMPETTAVFDTGRRPTAFVHGGNSLQERVIPVLTLVHRAAAGGSALQYSIAAEAREGVAGMHCLAVKLEVAAQRALDFGSPREIELGLRVVDLPGIQVELCQVRGPAKISGGVVVAPVGQSFELFFRLVGSTDARVLVEVHHPSSLADVTPGQPDTRFPVTASRAASDPKESQAAPTPADWLAQLPEGGVRQLFAHLAAHAAVTENEAANILGGQRELRRFALRFEEWRRKAPFNVRIDVVAGVKRYVREGAGS